MSFVLTESDVASIVLFGGNGEDIAGTVTVSTETGVVGEVVVGEKSILLKPAAVSELARLVKLLEEHGMDASEFRSSASRLIDTILSQVGSDGNPVSCWDTRTGEILSRGGDGGGYVLMGLARWMQLLGDRALLPGAIDIIAGL